MAQHLVGLVPIKPIGAGTPGQFDGTRLVFRQDANSAPQPLGFVVAVPSVPRWMSPEFPNAVAEAIDLNQYAQDWFEKIIFVDDQSLTDNATATKVVNWSAQTAALGRSFDHVSSFGCSRVVPRTRVNKVAFSNTGDVSGSDIIAGGPFYALVSNQDTNDSTLALEITIAPLAARDGFIKSAKHQEQLKLAASLRQMVDPQGAIAGQRQSEFTAIKAFNGTP
jgi:hypothetical protein